ncbi:hypothetical protein XENTR_v10019719 [Xenopus tropicalis]|uniref:Uncharacterized protein LOC101731020 n=1 Tax=Xenopus tropicalis TaxID=8364 RepID=A0A8J1JYX6_XENTR|nr:uncharacterized protein LOC101731020 [Xenopus tropicalis]KAE8594622.1 hypothetical protein XENTR_v10019719 [Xenopus tropicalis]
MGRSRCYRLYRYAEAHVSHIRLGRTMSMEMPRAPGCYPILNEPPLEYDSVYIDPPACESLDPSSIDPTLPQYQPSPQPSTAQDESSRPSPPGNHETPPPYSITNSHHASPQAPAHCQLGGTKELRATNFCIVFSFINFLLFPLIGVFCIIKAFKVIWFRHRGEPDKVEKLSVDLYHTNKLFFFLCLLLGIFYTSMILIIVLTPKGQNSSASFYSPVHYWP